jgi:hypothetical protein
MMRFASTILFLILVASGIAAQDKCERLPQRVQIRGLYLRQTMASARQAIPSLRIKQKVSGLSEAELKFRPNSPRPANLKDVIFLKAEFLDGKLYSVISLYNRSTLWSDSEAFVADISRKLGLPDAPEWSVYSADDRFYSCGSDVVIAGISDGFPKFLLMDGKAVVKVDDRQKAAAYAQQELQEAIRDEKRAKFKP